MEDDNLGNDDVAEYFYERRVPETDELVMCRVNSIDDMGVLCSLLEYNNLEGFLPLSEISRKRMRSVLRHVRVGQRQILQVLRVDTEHGYTDLSKKYVTEVERDIGNEKYIKGKTVHNITKRVAETHHKDLEEIYKQYVWPLYEKYKHPFDAFKLLAADEEDIWKDMAESDPVIKEAFLRIIKHQMAVQPVKVGAQIEVTCFSEGGIDDIKKALRKGLTALSSNTSSSSSSSPAPQSGTTAEGEVKIQLISSPLYLAWTTTIDEARGCEALNTVIKQIEDEITASGGSLKVIKEPAVIGKSE
eukprot:TRINITY_DN2623_c0_g1_i1.p1 TRINITY_DN2623_c0_g1~~TRINITY_DN2623_c0_g1_i1.p1  ORF type:complete len:302 (-),score=97.27 TRINITY_DN2623_c0_g1_i1:81-986(-)